MSIAERMNRLEFQHDHTVLRVQSFNVNNQRIFFSHPMSITTTHTRMQLIKFISTIVSSNDVNIKIVEKPKFG